MSYTPETDAAWDAYYRGAAGLRYVRDKMESFERQRDEAFLRVHGQWEETDAD